MRLMRLCVAVFGAFVLALTSAVPASAATTATYDLWVWNVAGWTMHRASTTDGLIPALTGSIRARGAEFVGLNELCYQQYQAIVADLRASGWPQDSTNFARFESSRDTVCNGQAFGNAIFSKAPLGAANRYTLPSDGSAERRTLLCAPLSARPHLRFCATHITPSNTVINGTAINVQQLNSVRSRLEAFAASGDTVLIAGDFNAQPNYGRLNNWYAPSLNVANNASNTGFYRELDDLDSRCVGYGETTVAAGSTGGPCGLGNKIDLIFVRENKLAGSYTADSLAIPTTCTIGACSDHRVVTGTVTVSIN
ncbi:endonuclease/exonuclease/phosphatase family protein [Micromonospora sp. NPDC020750]|uniref:endonuclease/exonuclease/phosphatase family protein n=1 Tax=unclassified Micromonospora TaxID=2617518 RepID=UPI00379D16C7